MGKLGGIMNRLHIMVTSIILIFLTLTPVHAVDFKKAYDEKIEKVTGSINDDRNLNQVRRWISGNIDDERSPNRMEKIKILSKGIDNDDIFRFWIKSKHMSFEYPQYDIRKQFKLNIIRLEPIHTDRLKVEAEIDIRYFNTRPCRYPSDIFCVQFNASYKINEDVLLEIGSRRKFCDRIKVNLKQRSRRANGLTLKIKNTDLFFLPIDMTKAYYGHKHYQFNYIAGAYSEKFHSSDNHQLDLFGFTKKRSDMSNLTVDHCLIGGAKLRISHDELSHNPLESKKIHQALRLTYQYHIHSPMACTNHSLQWEAKLTNCFRHDRLEDDGMRELASKLDVNFYIATKAFRNVFEDKNPWAAMMEWHEHMYGFYRPRCGIRTILTKKFTKELTFSLDGVMFSQVIIKDKHLRRPEFGRYLDLIETRFKATAEYNISDNIIFNAAIGNVLGFPHGTFNGSFDTEFSIVVKEKQKYESKNV
jgi:hypothetical protein